MVSPEGNEASRRQIPRLFSLIAIGRESSGPRNRATNHRGGRWRVNLEPEEATLRIFEIRVVTPRLRVVSVSRGIRAGAQ
jgi:hypothetical protein